MDEQRIAVLERQVADLTARVQRLDTERRTVSPHAVSLQAPPAPDVRRVLSRPSLPSVPRPDRSLEDLLGGRVLAWAGGAAVLVGLGLLFALAIDSGWIGEGARTAMGTAFAAIFLGAGLRLHRGAGRTHASLALAGTGIAGLFMAAAVATSGYDLLPVPIGLAAAAMVGGGATWLAIRWRAQVVAWLGLLGAVASPLLTSAPQTTATAAFLLLATACAGAVVVAERWHGLGAAVLGLAACQWIPLAFDASIAGITALLAGFGAIGLATVLGAELRDREPEAGRMRLAMLATHALVLAVAGYAAYAWADAEAAGRVLLAVLAAVHAATGLAGLRTGRLSRPTSLVALVAGVLLADVAFATMTDGIVRALGWMVAVAGFAWLARRASGDRDRAALLAAGLGGHVALALLQALILAPPSAMGAGEVDAAGIVALAALAGTCLAVGAGLRDARPRWGDVANATGLVVAALAMVAALDGLALVLALAAEAVALARIGRRQRDEVATYGADAALLLATGVTLVVLASPTALADGLTDLGPALLAVSALGVAAACMARTTRRGHHRDARVAASATALLYAMSCAAVSLPLAGGGLDQGQLQLTALWALAGVIALVVGVMRDVRALRLAALGLLGVAAGKAFLFDLATLAPAQRIGSLLGLGLLLLGGAFVYQRLRPEAPADLRTVPSALR